MLDIVYHNYAESPAEFQNFLDLGGALAAAGLIGLVYQFRTTLWALVLRIRGGIQEKLIWIFSGVGLFIMLVKALILGGGFKLLTRNPVYYDIFAYLMFIASPASMLVLSLKNKIYKPSIKDAFHKELVREISKGSEDSIQAAFNLFMINFEAVCISIKSDDKITSESARFMTNEVLSEENIVEILTTKRLDALIFFFECLEKYKLNASDLIVCMPKITQKLLLDDQSFLYRHLELSGLSLSSCIYKVFDFPNILENFDLLNDYQLGYIDKEEFKSIRVKVFIEVLEKLIENYKKSFSIHSHLIKNDLRNLNELFRNLCLKIGAHEKQGINVTHVLIEERMGLHLIAHFLTKYKAIKEKDIFFDAGDSHPSIVNSIFANSLSKAFESLSFIENSSITYHTVITLFDGLEFGAEQSVEYLAEFEKNIWEKIAKNLKQKLYPITLKSYLEYLAIRLVSNSFRTNSWMDDLIEKTRILLYVDLKPLLDQNATMVDQKYMKEKVLPKSMVYENNSFAYIDKLGNKQSIVPPAENASSILDSICL
ncbi:putative uncharacterized protein [Parachlamydia acanthamoebae UV-7]|uniref:Uncharacterized protein n=2 Tax=Parachlamydia acanthamoebae TaxID=83552 RepID=F8L1J1_PARAV|nr:hypothetical protein [Parachlamydia acanthamoebae]KIA77181.1 hypothetical protein DB43_GT00220 [Parachlamydia acanthamoebae]CCB87133.1 putative uncharacterized protein [Parachlamydia acanthamoebae UV-7]